MATIVKGEKRGRPGKWIVDYRDSAGIRRWLTFDTKEKATDALAAKITESRQQTQPLGDPNVTVNDYAAKWLETIKATQKPRTHELYSTVYRLHIAPALGACKVRKVSKGQCKAVLVDKLNGNNVIYVRLMRAVISGIFNSAVDDGLILANPAAGLGRKLKLTKLGSAEPEEIQAFTTEQLTALLAHAGNYHDMFLLMARTGLRVGEAVALQWSDT